MFYFLDFFFTGYECDRLAEPHTIYKFYTCAQSPLIHFFFPAYQKWLPFFSHPQPPYELLLFSIDDFLFFFFGQKSRGARRLQELPLSSGDQGIYDPGWGLRQGLSHHLPVILK